MSQWTDISYFLKRHCPGCITRRFLFKLSRNVRCMTINQKKSTTFKMHNFRMKIFFQSCQFDFIVCSFVVWNFIDWMRSFVDSTFLNSFFTENDQRTKNLITKKNKFENCDSWSIIRMHEKDDFVETTNDYFVSKSLVLKIIWNEMLLNRIEFKYRGIFVLKCRKLNQINDNEKNFV